MRQCVGDCLRSGRLCSGVQAMREEKINILSLFSGTHSWTWLFENNPKYNVISIDLEYLYPNTICRNILTWDYMNDNILKDIKIDIIFASPPCNLYFTHLKKQKGMCIYTENDRKTSLMLVDKTIEIIKSLLPRYWTIENSVGKMRWYYPVILGCKYRTIDYCMYGMRYKKPTDMWSNIPFIPRRCEHGVHGYTVIDHPSSRKFKKYVKRGIINTEQYRAMIAPGFVKEIYNTVNKAVKVKTAPSATP